MMMEELPCCVGAWFGRSLGEATLVFTSNIGNTLEKQETPPLINICNNYGNHKTNNTTNNNVLCSS